MVNGLQVGICAFFYMQNLFSVVMLSLDLWSIRGGGYGVSMHGYMCILQYVKQLYQCSGVA